MKGGPAEDTDNRAATTNHPQHPTVQNGARPMLKVIEILEYRTISWEMWAKARTTTDPMPVWYPCRELAA